MGFKMKGNPAAVGGIHGTTGHASALKMAEEAEYASALKKLAEEKASALKHSGGDSGKHHMNISGDSDHYAWQDPKNKDQKGGNETKKEKNVRKYGKEDPYGDAAKKDPKLKDYVAKRKTLEKGSDEWKRNQNKINEAYGSSKRYEVSDEVKGREVTGNKKVDKISASQDKVEAKGEIKKGEVTENVGRTVTRKEVKKTKKQHGKDSQEYKDARVGREEARLADLEGSKGGKRSKFLGNIRRKISKKRLAKRKVEAGQTDETTEE